MPYTIPSSTISPGTVYQPRGGLPGVIKSNARAIYATGATAFNSTRMLDLLPSHNGTRRTGEQGRCFLYDGTDDYSQLDSAITLSGDFSLSWNMTPTSLTVQHLFIQTSANRIFIVNASTITFVIDGVGNEFTISPSLSVGSDHHICFVRESGLLTLYVDGLAQTDTENNANTTSLSQISLSTNPAKASIYDIRIYNKALSQSEVNFVKSFGQTGTDPSLPIHWWKCDEQSGTVGYDSVGGNNLTHVNATLANFHSTQDIWSFQNQVGYNLSGGVYIPRDESDTTNDVLGNPLTYTGKRPNDAALTGSNCLTADGTLYIAATHLTGSETVVSSGGTSTPSISAGRIDFTAGTCWDLTLSDGTHYPLSEGWGVDIGSSTSDNDGTLTSAILANAWGATQANYHYNLFNGFTLYEHATTDPIRWPYKNGSPKTLTPPTGYSKTSDNPAGNYHNNAETTIDFDPDSTPEMGATQLGITVPSAHGFGDAWAASDQTFSRQRTLTEDRFVIMPEAQTGADLATIQKYTQP